MLLATMIPANPVFHHLHQAINGSSIEQAQANVEIKKEIEAAQNFTKEQEIDKKGLKGFGLGQR